MEAPHGITIYLSCPDCSVVYSAKQARFDQMTSGKFDCIECGKAVHMWLGRYGYLHWKPVTHSEG